MISALLPNYARAELAFERGEGAWLYTVDGRRLLDFGSGIATASLGHGHPHLSKAIAEQAAKVMHVSNLYRIPGAERLAQRLVDATFADSVFFCNSGAEANEGMIKMMRRAMFDAGQPRAVPLRRVRGRVPRPHAGHARRHRQRQVPGRVRAGGRGLRPGAVQQHERGTQRDWPRHRRHHRRAGAGRGRRASRPNAVPARPARRVRRVRPAARAWTRCSPAWAAPASCSRTSGPALCPTSCRRRRASAAASLSARCWPRSSTPRR